ncbi:MAG: MFS transporter [Desulfobacula sp.]|nr:MFS transporter [Desulfobacula sp.]
MKKTALWGLAILTICNLFNYMDRYLFNSLAPAIKRDFDLTNFEVGMLASIFGLIYIIACPLAGLLGDKYKRPRILGGAMFFWSLVTASAGLARGFWTMLIPRSLSGIGEAACSSIGCSLVEDYSPKAWKGRAMAVFLIAMPLGTAMGYLAGGYIDAWIGWKWAFPIVGIPGMLIALLVWNIKEPVPDLGANKDDFLIELKNNFKTLIHNRVYLYAIIGYTAFTFVTGAMAAWVPEIMVSAKGLSLKDGNIIFGGTMVITGIVATGLGAILTDVLRKHTHRAAALICAISALLSIPFLIIALNAEGRTSLFLWLLAAETFLFLNTTPITLIILESVKFDQRSVAMGFSVLAIHLFGDALSPAIVGWWADKTDVITACITILPGGLVVTAVFWFLCFSSQKKSSDIKIPPHEKGENPC